MLSFRIKDIFFCRVFFWIELAKKTGVSVPTNIDVSQAIDTAWTYEQKLDDFIGQAWLGFDNMIGGSREQTTRIKRVANFWIFEKFVCF